jgi:hypothetical protein
MLHHAHLIHCILTLEMMPSAVIGDAASGNTAMEMQTTWLDTEDEPRKRRLIRVPSCCLSFIYPDLSHGICRLPLLNPILLKILYIALLHTTKF